MTFNRLPEATAAQLLALFADVLGELRQRGIARSANNPVGDYAEHLVAKALGLELSSNSTAGYDATDAADGTRYQVKGRRLTGSNPSRQLSAIRNLPDRHFDYLAGVLFAADFSVARACLIPVDVVEREATYVAHTNSWRLMLRDGLWSQEGVRDITEAVRAAALDEARQEAEDCLPVDAPEAAAEATGSDSVRATAPASTDPVAGTGMQPVAEPRVTYTFSRFCFKADAIEPLAMADAFRMVTARDGAFQMTKAEFYRDFANVPPTVAYRRDRRYHSRTVPKKAEPYRISQ